MWNAESDKQRIGELRIEELRYGGIKESRTEESRSENSEECINASILKKLVNQ